MSRSLAYGLGLAGGVITLLTGLLIMGAGSLLGSYLHLISAYTKTALWFAGFWGIIVGLFIIYCSYMLRTSDKPRSWSSAMIFIGVLGYITLQGLFIGPGAAIIAGIIGIGSHKAAAKKRKAAKRRIAKKRRRR